jgi:glucose 1-dehydrogenase
MRAITLLPGVPNSARIDDVPPPREEEGAVLVRSLALGVCGTDREILAGEYGSAPPGQQRLILGHESFGEVESAPKDSGFKTGDLVVGIVRRPDPVPCASCAAGEWDMCQNGRYTERGIKDRHGYGSEYFRVEPDFAVKIAPALGNLGVLLEPASIVAKAWDHIERIGQRSRAWKPRKVLITGAGPIGLLAAMLGVERGLDVIVFDRNTEGIKPALIRELGAGHHLGPPGEFKDLAPDIVIECTGAWTVVRDVLGVTAPDGITCLTSVTAPGHRAEIDVGLLNRKLVLDNDVIFGTVNANRAHYQMAAEALAFADQAWLKKLITRRASLEQWGDALDHRKGDIKVVVDFTL